MKTLVTAVLGTATVSLISVVSLVMVTWEDPVKRDVNQLRTLVTGFHKYHDTFGKFPNVDLNIIPVEKKAVRSRGLSWRVHLLPQLGLDDLYKKFKLDESWDSASNIKFVAEMPEIYKTQGVSKAGHTGIHVFVQTTNPGPERNTIFLAPSILGIEDRSINAYETNGGTRHFVTDNEILDSGFSHIVDGTSNTILIVKAGPSVAEPWSRPGYLEVGETPLKSLGDTKEIGDIIPVGLANGDVVFLNFNKLNEHLFQALLTRAGGEDVNALIEAKPAR